MLPLSQADTKIPFKKVIRGSPCGALLRCNIGNVSVALVKGRNEAPLEANF